MKKIDPAEVLLTVLIGMALAALVALKLNHEEVPDVLNYLVSGAAGALFARMLPDRRTTPEEPVRPALPPGFAVVQREDAERLVAQPEDRPWETQ